MDKEQQLISEDEAVTVTMQHVKPCADCPWARKSLPGWLGNMTAEQWVDIARGEAVVECHTMKFLEGQGTCQCAGLATFRKNMCKVPRNKQVLILEADRGTVFSHPGEFLQHHTKS